MTRRDEEGYALVAAVASMAVFSAMALTVLSATHLEIGDASAEQDRLQVGAAAEAGVALVLSKLLASDGEGWAVGGRERHLRYGDAQLTVRVEDELGKVPISRLDEKLATRLLEEVGLDGDRLLIARDSLLDWTDSDNQARPYGAEAAYYQSEGIAPPNGFLSSIDELRRIRGFDAETVERLRPMVTTYTAMASFDPRYANPQALAVMEDAGQQGGPRSIDREKELAGQQTAIAFANTNGLTGRPLTVNVEAKLPDGARSFRRIVVELTGVSTQPYLIRAAD
ncbi:type II secretion system protein GspK [Sphingomonas sp. H39-1-10]|uniref:general secretion pathway protein GspK n=1 Tax=Sphingomonas pollutisoli TaxID=3030829 RepID=UPI0023B8976D|nr:type II secretion system protein GspK [Sphingomonas pollutisoli]MDF0487765.1 type II secretion system protein GspK [Sphingomonas pollutisoli]